jgi:hypothetical protein
LGTELKFNCIISLYRGFKKLKGEKMIDKVIRIKKLHEKKDDYKYWISVSIEDRFNELENIRKEYHGENYEIEQGFQRFLRVLKQK